jgi:hypothetical protein
MSTNSGHVLFSLSLKYLQQYIFECITSALPFSAAMKQGVVPSLSGVDRLAPNRCKIRSALKEGVEGVIKLLFKSKKAKA